MNKLRTAFLETVGILVVSGLLCFITWLIASIKSLFLGICVLVLFLFLVVFTCIYFSIKNNKQ